MKGLAIFLGSIVAGLAIGLAVGALVWSITGDDKIGSAVGTGFWLISAFIIHAYTSVWVASLGGFNTDEIARSKDRFQRKLQTAEIRYAFVFALIGGAMTQSVGAPWYLAVAVGTPLVILGAFVGYDIKRRYKRIGLV
jgi:hypothetical protein